VIKIEDEDNSLEEMLQQLADQLPAKHGARQELDELREHRATFYKLASLRLHGWYVAVHNDYVLDGVLKTFWGFSRGHQWVKGEGQTDLEAINEALGEARALGDAVKKVGGR
jgi:hypothetical protein